MPNDKSDELVRVRSKFMAAWIVKRLGVDQKVGRRIPIHRNGHWNDWTISDNGRTITRK